MDKKGSYSYVIDSRDIDYRGRATLTAMVHYILEAAGEDADLNGFGVSDLNCDNCTWVLSRISVDILSRPSQGDRITVRTWVNEVNRIMTTRNMEVTNAAGERIALAVTLWSIIDLDKRTPLDIREHVDYENAVTSETSPTAKPAKVRHVQAQQTASHRVVYSDIDFNRHMNSLRYLTVMYDMLPEEYFDRREAARMDVNFIHEARFGQELTVTYEQDAHSFFEIADAGGQALCRMSIGWR